MKTGKAAIISLAAIMMIVVPFTVVSEVSDAETSDEMGIIFESRILDQSEFEELFPNGSAVIASSVLQRLGFNKNAFDYSDIIMSDISMNAALFDKKNGQISAHTELVDSSAKISFTAKVKESGVGKTVFENGKNPEGSDMATLTEFFGETLSAGYTLTFSGSYVIRSGNGSSSEYVMTQGDNCVVKEKTSSSRSDIKILGNYCTLMTGDGEPIKVFGLRGIALLDVTYKHHPKYSEDYPDITASTPVSVTYDTILRDCDRLADYEFVLDGKSVVVKNCQATIPKPTERTASFYLTTVSAISGPVDEPVSAMKAYFHTSVDLEQYGKVTLGYASAEQYYNSIGPDHNRYEPLPAVGVLVGLSALAILIYFIKRGNALA